MRASIAFVVLALSSTSAFALAPDEFPPLHAASASPDAPAAGDRDSYPPVEPLFSARFAKLALKDAADVFTSPARFDRDDWRELGYAGLGLAVCVAVVDRPVRDLVQRNRSGGEDRFLKDIEPFGTKRYTIPTLGAFYVYGLAADDPIARATAQDGVIVSFVANTVTSGFKGLFGRARPFQEHGPHHFAPLQGDTSFPSGHTTQAFAIASVIAEHYQDTWAPYAAYGVAGLVGFARIDHDRHWLSDVLAGAMVGRFVGREIVRFNTSERAEHSSFAPTIAADADGLALSWSF